MSKTTETTPNGRRHFLKGLLLAGGALGSGVGLAAATAAAPHGTRQKEMPPKRLGYRETEHVRTYYAKASL